MAQMKAEALSAASPMKSLGNSICISVADLTRFRLSEGTAVQLGLQSRAATAEEVFSVACDKSAAIIAPMKLLSDILGLPSSHMLAGSPWLKYVPLFRGGSAVVADKLHRCGYKPARNCGNVPGS